MGVEAPSPKRPSLLAFDASEKDAVQPTILPAVNMIADIPTLLAEAFGKVSLSGALAKPSGFPRSFPVAVPFPSTEPAVDTDIRSLTTCRATALHIDDRRLADIGTDVRSAIKALSVVSSYQLAALTTLSETQTSKEAAVLSALYDSSKHLQNVANCLLHVAGSLTLLRRQAFLKDSVWDEASKLKLLRLPWATDRNFLFGGTIAEVGTEARAIQSQTATVAMLGLLQKASGSSRGRGSPAFRHHRGRGSRSSRSGGRGRRSNPSTDTRSATSSNKPTGGNQRSSSKKGER